MEGLIYCSVGLKINKILADPAYLSRHEITAVLKLVRIGCYFLQVND